MSLHEVEGSRAERWDRALAGSLDRLLVRSELLEHNPLRDSPVRPLFVYRPPDRGRPLPSVYLLQGFGGRLEEWLAPGASGPATIERLDAMFSARECPPALLVFPDASTAWGGSQFLNSAGCGRYLDYVCDEVVPFVDAHYPALAAREHRGVSGKSSGGYGALVLSMLRPDVFGAVASHAGDALFECCYQPFFPLAARLLRTHFEGSWQAFAQHARAPAVSWREFPVLFATYGMACAYSPDPELPEVPLIPFDSVGRPIEEIWSQWLALDPVRMVERHAEALASARMIHLEAGSGDEFFLDLGATALSNELARIGVDHSLELFDGNHDGVDERIPTAVRTLVSSLQ